jgi:hypothetical protein
VLTRAEKIHSSDTQLFFSFPGLEHLSTFFESPFGFMNLERHQVGLLCTRCQLIAKASTDTGKHNIQTQVINIRAPSEIRTSNPSNQAASYGAATFFGIYEFNKLKQQKCHSRLKFTIPCNLHFGLMLSGTVVK